MSTTESLLRSGIRGLRRTVAPTFQAVDATAIMGQAHIDITDEAALLDDYIESATEYAEQYQNRCLRQSTWQAAFDYFPCVFYLPVPPLIAVTSVGYTDSAGDAQTLASSLYVVDAISQPGRVSLAYGEIWPSTLSQIASVTVTFTAGYTSAANIPARTRQAIRMLAAYWFLNREAVVVGQAANALPLGVTELLDADKLLVYR